MTAPLEPQPFVRGVTMPATAETAQEDVRNALAILETCAVRIPTSLVNLKDDEYEAVKARLYRAVAKLESEARK